MLLHWAASVSRPDLELSWRVLRLRNALIKIMCGEEVVGQYELEINYQGACAEEGPRSTGESIATAVLARNRGCEHYGSPSNPLLM